MRETEHAASSTIRRRLAALSSLFKHLVRHGHAARNPVGEVERPAINRDEGTTLAFSKVQARKLLDTPAEDTIAGLARPRDPVGRLAGRLAPRRDRRAQGRRPAPEPRLSTRCASCARAAGATRWRSTRRPPRGCAPISRPPGTRPTSTGRCSGRCSTTASRRDERRHMDPDAIDRVVRKYAAALGLDRGYSAHSMRATFITTALENGAQLEDVQKAAGHRDPSTTKLYDRRGYNPEKAASFFATY